MAAVPISPAAALFHRRSSSLISRSRARVSAMSIATEVAVVPAVILGGGRIGTMLQSLGDGRDVVVRRRQTVPADSDGPIFVCTRNDDLEAVLEATPASRWNAPTSVEPSIWQAKLPSPPHLSRASIFKLGSSFRWALGHCGSDSIFIVGLLHSWILPDPSILGDRKKNPKISDLVFFQNGMLDPWLQSKGLNAASQVLAYFAVSKLGEPPVDGKTDTNPEGLTVAFGKWASAVTDRLHSGGLSCKVLEKEAFEKHMLEKLIWIAAFMLVGACHPGATVGVVEKDYRSEVASLIDELAAAAAAERGLTFEDGMVDRLCAYARAVSHFPTAVKEFKWRNGWFYSLTEKAMTEGKPDPCPLHTAWLKELKIVQDMNFVSSYVS